MKNKCQGTDMSLQHTNSDTTKHSMPKCTYRCNLICTTFYTLWKAIWFAPYLLVLISIEYISQTNSVKSEISKVCHKQYHWVCASQTPKTFSRQIDAHSLLRHNFPDPKFQYHTGQLVAPGHQIFFKHIAILLSANLCSLFNILRTAFLTY